MSQGAGDIYATLRLRLDEFDKGINKARNMVDKLGKQVGLSFNFRGLASLGAAVLGFRSLNALINTTVQAAGRQQDALNRVDAALRSTGQYTNSLARDLEKQAYAFQTVSRHGDEVISEQQALLISFGATKDNVKSLTQAALDLSAGLGVQLHAATQAVGRAMNGQTLSLRRYGIQIANTVDPLKRIEMIQRAVAEKFGGRAAADVETYAGRLAQFRNAISDVQESIGGLIANSPFLQKFLQQVSIDLREWATQIPREDFSQKFKLDAEVKATWEGWKATLSGTWTFLKWIYEKLDGITQKAVDFGLAIDRWSGGLNTDQNWFNKFFGAVTGQDNSLWSQARQRQRDARRAEIEWMKQNGKLGQSATADAKLYEGTPRDAYGATAGGQSFAPGYEIPGGQTIPGVSDYGEIGQYAKAAVHAPNLEAMARNIARARKMTGKAAEQKVIDAMNAAARGDMSGVRQFGLESANIFSLVNEVSQKYPAQGPIGASSDDEAAMAKAAGEVKKRLAKEEENFAESRLRRTIDEAKSYQDVIQAVQDVHAARIKEIEASRDDKKIKDVTIADMSTQIQLQNEGLYNQKRMSDALSQVADAQRAINDEQTKSLEGAKQLTDMRAEDAKKLYEAYGATWDDVAAAMQQVDEEQKAIWESQKKAIEEEMVGKRLAMKANPEDLGLKQQWLDLENQLKLVNYQLERGPNNLRDWIFETKNLGKALGDTVTEALKGLAGGTLKGKDFFKQIGASMFGKQMDLGIKDLVSGAMGKIGTGIEGVFGIEAIQGPGVAAGTAGIAAAAPYVAAAIAIGNGMEGASQAYRAKRKGIGISSQDTMDAGVRGFHEGVWGTIGLSKIGTLAYKIDSLQQGFLNKMTGGLLKPADGRAQLPLQLQMMSPFLGMWSLFNSRLADKLGPAKYLLPGGAMFAGLKALGLPSDLGLFRGPTAGTQVRRAVAPFLQKLEFPQLVGGSKFTGYQKEGLGAEMYSGLLDEASAGALLFVANMRKLPKTQKGKTLATSDVQDRIRNTVVNSLAEAAFGTEDAEAYIRKFVAATEKDLDAALTKLQVLRKQGKITTDEQIASTAGLLDAFQDLPDAIDTTRLAMMALGKDGTTNFKEMKEQMEYVTGYFESAFPAAISAAIQSGNVEDAGVELAKQFSQVFIDEMGKELLNSKLFGPALQEAVAMIGKATEAFAAGNDAAGRAYLDKAWQLYQQGEKRYEKAIGPVVGAGSKFYDLLNPAAAFQGGVSVPSMDTATMTVVPGMRGRGRLGLVHGGETVRSPAQEDQILQVLSSIFGVLNKSAENPIHVESKVIIDGREIAKVGEANRVLQRFGPAFAQTVGMRR